MRKVAICKKYYIETRGGTVFIRYRQRHIIYTMMEIYFDSREKTPHTHAT